MTDHVKLYHPIGLYFARNMTIKNRTIEYQDAGGTWKPWKAFKTDNCTDNTVQQAEHSVSLDLSPTANGEREEVDTVNSHLVLPSTSAASSISASAVPVPHTEMKLVEGEHCLNIDAVLKISNDYAIATAATETNKMVALTSITKNDHKVNDDEDSQPLCNKSVNDPAVFANTRITSDIISLLVNSRVSQTNSVTSRKLRDAHSSVIGFVSFNLTRHGRFVRGSHTAFQPIAHSVRHAYCLVDLQLIKFEHNMDTPHGTQDTVCVVSNGMRLLYSTVKPKCCAFNGYMTIELIDPLPSQIS
jgi:hypothetical protein